MSRKDAFTDVAKSMLASGWTPEKLREREEECGDPVITEAIANRMAEIIKRRK